MAVTVTKTGFLTDVSMCESATGWTSTNALTTYTGFQREGTNCLGGQCSQSTNIAYYTIGSASLANKRVYVWMLTWGNVDTIANGGFGVTLGDGTNRRSYYVGGADRSMHVVSGSWICLCLDTANLPAAYSQDAGSSAPNLAAITQVGCRVKILSKAVSSSPTFFIDCVRYGTGILVTGGSSGDPGTWAQLEADDASIATGKAYGIIRKLAAGVYGIQGDITFGDNSGTGTFYFKDSDAVVVVEDRIIGAGTPLDINLTVVGNATAATQHFEQGLAVSSGDTESGRNGVTFRNSNTVQPVVFDASDADLDECLLYGCTFTNIYKAATRSPKFSSDATNGVNHHVDGCTFDRCGQVDLGRAHARNVFFSGYTPAAGAALLWNANINAKYCQFVANTGANSPAAIEHPALGTVSYYGMKFLGNTYDVKNSVAAVTADSYSESNRDGQENLNDTVFATGQSFTGTAAILSSMSFWLQKVGTPAGTMAATLYLATGAVGSETPTGSALATSVAKTANSIGTSWALVKFDFVTTNQYTMSAGTKYVAVLEYASGTSSAYVQAGLDASSPGHSNCNQSYYSSSTWTAVSGKDLCFYVRTGAYVQVNTSDGANPGTSTETGSPAGVTYINAAVSLAVRVVGVSGTGISGVRVAIYRTADNVELLNTTTDVNGDVSTSVAYAGDTPIYIRVRKSTSGTTRYVPIDATGTVLATGFAAQYIVQVDSVAA